MRALWSGFYLACAQPKSQGTYWTDISTRRHLDFQHSRPNTGNLNGDREISRDSLEQRSGGASSLRVLYGRQENTLVSH